MSPSPSVLSRLWKIQNIWDNAVKGSYCEDWIYYWSVMLNCADCNVINIFRISFSFAKLLLWRKFIIQCRYKIKFSVYLQFLTSITRVLLCVYMQILPGDSTCTQPLLHHTQPPFGDQTGRQNRQTDRTTDKIHVRTAGTEQHCSQYCIYYWVSTPGTHKIRHFNITAF